jgi:quercetin dioxygenase-like cupin family protein
VSFERERSQLGVTGPTYYADWLKDSTHGSAAFPGNKSVVKAEDMVWEETPQGLIRHMVNDQMGTREPCLDIYQQWLKPGQASGKHRHASEELLYVIEGSGYDLHWDVTFSCTEEFEWSWADEPRRFDWKAGDFVYVPPWTLHQHFQAGEDDARFISTTSRIVKLLGFDWWEQVEDAPK